MCQTRDLAKSLKNLGIWSNHYFTRGFGQIPKISSHLAKTLKICSRDLAESLKETQHNTHMLVRHLIDIFIKFYLLHVLYIIYNFFKDTKQFTPKIIYLSS